MHKKDCFHVSRSLTILKIKDTITPIPHAQTKINSFLFIIIAVVQEVYVTSTKVVIIIIVEFTTSIILLYPPSPIPDLRSGVKRNL
jgi:hypothetical protein